MAEAKESEDMTTPHHRSRRCIRKLADVANLSMGDKEESQGHKKTRIFSDSETTIAAAPTAILPPAVLTVRGRGRQQCGRRSSRR